MTDKTKYTSGLAMTIFGVALLLLNAADKILRWNQISPALFVIGIVFAVTGAGLMRRTKDDPKKQ